MIAHQLLQGSKYSDERGILNFFNAFDMSEVVRMYEIAPSDTKLIRGWQGHQQEKKWFYCHRGAFIVNLIKLDSFESSEKEVCPERFILTSKNPSVLEISGGHATGFKALEANSKLLVFSNFSLAASKADDFRYPIEHWEADW